MASLRVSDADRERVAGHLRERSCEGYLSLETFAARLDRVYRARWDTDLAEVVSDLPTPRRTRVRETWSGLWARLSAGFAVTRSAEDDARPAPLLLRGPGGRDARPERVLLGRAPDADYRLLDDTVSRRHAEVLWRDGDCVICDLGSTNGVYVNGRRVWCAALHPGDEITLGRSSLVFEGVDVRFPVPAAST